MALYQNTRNGQIVEFISHHDKDFALVRTSGGKAAYVPLTDLISYEAGVGRTGETLSPQSAIGAVDEDAIPSEALPVDTRLNINTATPESIAKTLKGVGYSTAKKICEYRMSLPGERFRELEQLRRIPRANWDQIIKEDLIYIG
jgi:competence ComEA-like helix-hairpin-helix protein